MPDDEDPFTMSVVVTRSIFERYGGFRAMSNEAFEIGDTVKINKEGQQHGKIAEVLDPSWKGLVKVKMQETGDIKSYSAGELRLHNSKTICEA